MIRCLLVDDEPIALRVLRSHLEKIGDVEVVASCTNPLEALRIAGDNDVDLIFLDIEMPELSGIGFVESLTAPPLFVFTTAHRNYAVQGFELEAVDYLLKPIGFPRLHRAVERYRWLTAAKEGVPEGIGTDASPAHINVRVDRRTVRIDVRDIAYAESLRDYVIIHTRSDRYMTKLRLTDLAAELEPHGFVRLHRSYVAPVARIESFTSTEVQIGDAVLPISRSYRRDVLDRLSEDER